MEREHSRCRVDGSLTTLRSPSASPPQVRSRSRPNLATLVPSMCDFSPSCSFSGHETRKPSCERSANVACAMCTGEHVMAIL